MGKKWNARSREAKEKQTNKIGVIIREIVKHTDRALLSTAKEIWKIRQTSTKNTPTERRKSLRKTLKAPWRSTIKYQKRASEKHLCKVP